MTRLRTGAMAFDVASRPSFSVSKVEAVIGAGLFGGFQGGLMLQFWNTETVRQAGATVGWATLDGGWIMFLVYGILLAIPFVWVVDGSTTAFANKFILLSSKSRVLQRVIVPLLKISALGVTLYGLGQIYGLVVAVVVWGIALPAWLNLVVGYPAPFPYINGFTIFGCLTYGGMTGLAYGLILEA